MVPFWGPFWNHFGILKFIENGGPKGTSFWGTSHTELVVLGTCLGMGTGSAFSFKHLAAMDKICLNEFHNSEQV